MPDASRSAAEPDAARSPRAAPVAGTPFLGTQGAELEAVYANAPIGLCVLDRELRFVRINERLAQTKLQLARGLVRKRDRRDLIDGRLAVT